MSSSSSDDDEDLARQLRALQTSDIEDDDDDTDGDIDSSSIDSDDFEARTKRHGSIRKKKPKQIYPKHQPEAIKQLQKITGKSSTELQRVLYKSYVVPTRSREHRQIVRYASNGQNHGFGIEVVNIIRMVRNNDFEFRDTPPSAPSRHNQRPKPKPVTNTTQFAGPQPQPSSSSSTLSNYSFFSPRPQNDPNNISSPTAPPSSTNTKTSTTAATNNFRLMVWHGTKKQHVGSILTNGFQIPLNRNQMFGTGCYFADIISKSSTYCDSVQPGQEGYIFLCDVKLGKIYKAKNAHNGFISAPDGYDTVKCCGKRRPDWSKNAIMQGSTLPQGRTVDSSRFNDYTLNFNEYISYETARVKAKYLVVVKFHKSPRRRSK